MDHLGMKHFYMYYFNIIYKINIYIYFIGVEYPPPLVPQSGRHFRVSGPYPWEVIPRIPSATSFQMRDRLRISIWS